MAACRAARGSVAMRDSDARSKKGFALPDCSDNWNAVVVDYETFCRIRDHLGRQQLSVAQTARALALDLPLSSVNGHASVSPITILLVVGRDGFEGGPGKARNEASSWQAQSGDPSGTRAPIQRQDGRCCAVNCKQGQDS